MLSDKPRVLLLRCQIQHVDRKTVRKLMQSNGMMKAAVTLPLNPEDKAASKRRKRQRKKERQRDKARAQKRQRPGTDDAHDVDLDSGPNGDDSDDGSVGCAHGSLETENGMC